MNRLTGDTMIGPTGSNASGSAARVHGILLIDRGSCELPDRGTVTLAEWQQQNAVPVAMTALSLPPEVESAVFGADTGPMNSDGPGPNPAVA